MGELHLGTGSPQVQTALASTTPTQVAFAGTADQLADLLPADPPGGRADGRLVQGHRQLRQPRRQHQHPRLRHPGRRLPRRLRQGLQPQPHRRHRARLSPHQSERGRRGQRSIDTPRLAVYGSYTLGDFAIDATAGYAYDFIDSSRPFANLGQTASSSYNGQEANAAIQVSTRANFAGITFMPAAGLAFVHVAQTGVERERRAGVQSQRQRQQRQFAQALRRPDRGEVLHHRRRHGDHARGRHRL